MFTLIAFLVAIGALVTFHELGHYTVAKLCGVKVLRFSIGFGRPLVAWRMFDTEWALCPIPLGGYVRMLDEREAPVSDDERPHSFNAQPVLKRMAIVAAGPLANLLLAFLLYWVVMAHGVVQWRPWVGTVVDNTPAASAGFRAGDRVVAIGDRAVANWQEMRLALLDGLAGRTQPLDIRVMTEAGPAVRHLDVARFSQSNAQAFESGDIGIMPVRYLPEVGALEQDGVAMRAGLRPGDRMLSADGRTLPDWQSWVAVIRDNPGRALSVNILREGKPMTIVLRPASVDSGEGFVGHVGISPRTDDSWRAALQFSQRFDLPHSAQAAWNKTFDTSWMSLKFLGRMLVGSASTDNISGPLVIASVAGQSAREGLIAYLEFLALISVSIGILNLLPIPVLDGGHLMYYTAELVRGRPLSERVQLIGQRVGFALLFGLMAFAMLNDISRLFGG
ncbi:RIP metalloprotease RseP [Paludibacterium purpuratum]|uniref:Zinc metalloprotease n=1 Tax=Paludibacterium purpuratum TaxID=1144873 RepID=A0A4R7AZK4_9NEIS|nr:RIP metalloprotease RseP [Paludibacterium purpuratum]TDR73842.1 regulator of sigma E protease [Paludibacterium purpuratum]